MKESTIPFQWITLGYHWIKEEGSSRLEASFYSKDIIEARNLIKKLREKKVDVKLLQDSSLSKEIFWPGRFKRTYVSEKEGKPFLTASQIFMFLPKAYKYIINYPENILIEKDWILVTRSGSVGRVRLSNEILIEFIVSDDLVRIIPNECDLLGYIYAYLNTWIGQAFLIRTQYGATVKHIEPHHVSSIPIPIMQDSKEISEKMYKVHKLREEAQLLLKKAGQMLYEVLDLPLIDEENVEYFGEERGIVKTFITKTSELDLRLEASFNNPILTLIRNLLKNGDREGSFNLNKLSDLSCDIFTPPRFKRVYVEKPDDGIPLLHGGTIPWIKSLEMRYLWKNMDNIEKYIIKKNWILVTCSGTIGRTALVRDGWDNWTATNHITRIIPDGIHPGYLTIYLQSSYGQFQLESLSYGGVILEIGEAGGLFNDILIPLPSSYDIEEEIGNIVFEAYDKKDKANIIEIEIIKELENKLNELSS